ncbi:hypothetical protein ABID46_000855 [Moheibacter stercoris]|uniref:Uncharacterized protein n=1 Tax=Moheibacter stercoris TaxID=1628251 RepID=A0ABV2LRT4_9FLAO
MNKKIPQAFTFQPLNWYSTIQTILSKNRLISLRKIESIQFSPVLISGKNSQKK